MNEHPPTITLNKEHDCYRVQQYPRFTIHKSDAAEHYGTAKPWGLKHIWSVEIDVPLEGAGEGYTAYIAHTRAECVTWLTRVGEVFWGRSA